MVINRKTMVFIYLFVFIFLLYIKRVLAKGQKNYVKKKIPLVARPCKEDSRRNRSKGFVWSG